MKDTQKTSSTATTRRDFVKSVARLSFAAIAAPWIVPAGVVRAQTVPAANGAPATVRPVPSGRVTFALIGSGAQGRDGMGFVLRNPAAQVIGVCDPFKDRTKMARNQVNSHYKNQDCAAYGDFRELLARKDLDCVEIATGDYWHVPIALHAVRAGKDVYIEKPLGVAMKWAWVLRDEINKRKTVFQFGTWQRSRPFFRKACELVRNGVLGEIKRVDAWSVGLASDHGGLFNPKSEMRKRHLETAEIGIPARLDFEMWQGPAKRMPFTKAHFGHHIIFHKSDYAIGYIAGWGIHSVDIAQWGLGTDNTAPVSYQGTGRFPDIPGHFDTAATWDVECKYANGTEMHFMELSVAQPIVKKYFPHMRDHGTTFHGENGWISVDRTTMTASNKAWAKLDLGGQATRLHASPQNDQWADFIARVKDRKPTVNPIESAVNGDTICHLSNIAVHTGRKITWDPAREAIVGDAGAEAYLDRPLHAPWTL
ncbi:MAG: Gfo/Idh/MocA family oxidoreductase [Puniceicoccales bacterium]|nr:Gfo/Idh/MocA family oxidoreductase [Puniceicoccales bacterium]